MQAPGSLTPEQCQTLESVYLVLRTTRPLLSLLASKADATERFHLEATIRLIINGEQRLVEQFPELQPLAEKWKNRGGL